MGVSRRKSAIFKISNSERQPSRSVVTGHPDARVGLVEVAHQLGDLRDESPQIIEGGLDGIGGAVSDRLIPGRPVAPDPSVGLGGCPGSRRT